MTTFTLDSVKRAQDNWELIHKYRDQEWCTNWIRQYLREQCQFVVVRTPTTADDLAWDLRQIYETVWKLPNPSFNKS